MRRHSPYSRLLSNAILVGVYFVFFAVQLHLRYAFLSPVPISEQTTVAIQAAASSQQVKADRCIHAVKPEAKLNKRYHPQTVFEACLVKEAVSTGYTALRPVFPKTTAALYSTPLLHSPQRGPPCNG